MSVHLILASGSPRRASVLAQLGLTFETVVPDIDETPVPNEGPEELAGRLAAGKAAVAVAPDAIAFGFDTVVAHGGAILGKPGSRDEAVEMILRLSGDAHHVYSGIAGATPDRTVSAVERTTVWFRDVAREEAEAYVETGEPLDKAGAYGIQGAGATLVRRIEGDFFNVMGFPIQRFLDLLARFGLVYDFRTIVRSDDRG